MASVHLLFDPTNDWLSPFITPHIDDVRRGHHVSTGTSSRDAVDFDVLFVLGYTKLIGQEVLSRNKLNLVVHESALPQGRGFSPVQWQILANATSIPVCLIEVAAQADAGDIIDETTMELKGHELWPEIRRIQADATLQLIARFLTTYPNYRRTPQSGTPTTYRRRRADDDALDVDKTIRQQFNHLRIADNTRFPVYFELDGHRFVVRIYRDDESPAPGE